MADAKSCYPQAPKLSGAEGSLVLVWDRDSWGVSGSVTGSEPFWTQVLGCSSRAASRGYVKSCTGGMSLNPCRYYLSQKPLPCNVDKFGPYRLISKNPRGTS